MLSDKTITSLKSTTVVVYTVHAVLLHYYVTYKMWINEHGLSFISFRPMRFEILVEGDVEPHDKTTSTHCWFNCLGATLLEAALIILKHRSQEKMKRSLIHGAIYDLLTPFHASGKPPFQAVHTTNRDGLVYQYTSHTVAILHNQNVCQPTNNWSLCAPLPQIPSRKGSSSTPVVWQTSDFAQNRSSQ